MELKKNLGAVLCIIFVLSILSDLIYFAGEYVGFFNDVMDHVGSVLHVSPVFLFWRVYNLAICGLMIYLARHRNFFTSPVFGYIALVPAFIELLYFFNNMYVRVTDSVLISGNFWYVVHFILVVCIVVVFFGMKTKSVIKILASVPFVIGLIPDLMWIGRQLLYDNVVVDYDAYEMWIDLYNIVCNVIQVVDLLISVVVLVLTIRWMNSQSRLYSYSSKSVPPVPPIDMI